MDFLPLDLYRYCQQHTSKENHILKKIARETHLEVLVPRMLSGHLQGQFLMMIAALMQAKFVLEIGTYTGYSAVCLAQGMADNGKLITIDINEELQNRVQSYFDESGFAHKIEYKIGNALDTIPKLDIEFDIVFIDADKINYLNYYNLVIDKVRKGGLIMADNVLWSGKVVNTSGKIDKDTQAIVDFNHFVQHDPKVRNLLLPLRDGIMMAYKL